VLRFSRDTNSCGAPSWSVSLSRSSSPFSLRRRWSPAPPSRSAHVPRRARSARIRLGHQVNGASAGASARLRLAPAGDW